jgi:phosphoribosylanthranilate isomerase
MYTRLKICGITTLEDAQIAIEEGVQIIGFNFFSKSPRFISPTEAAAIINKIPFYVCCVGIFVGASLKEIQKILMTTKLNAIQIYQPENFYDFSQMSIPVILALRIKHSRDLSTSPYNGENMVLVDAYSPVIYGGTGKKFNWDIIPKDFPREKLILAGGINSNNIQVALEKVGPAIIDIASGAEDNPRKKSREKIRKLVTQMSEFNQQKMPSLS